MAFLNRLVKTQALYLDYGPYRDVHLQITDALGDAAYDAHGLWTFTCDRGVIPVFAPHKAVDPAQVSRRNRGRDYPHRG